MIFIVLAQKLNFAVVDVEKIKANYYDYKDALNQIRQFQLEKEKSLDSLKREIDSLKNLLSEQRAFLTDEGIYMLSRKIEQKEIDYQKLAREVHNQINQRYQQIVSPYISRIYSVIDSIAKRSNYDIVINKSANEIILYFTSASDITDIVLNELNKGYSAIVGTGISYIGIFAFKLNTKTSKLRSI
ncbi:MAG: OmpH family outer membrane protein, partial [candidate division WOR-3 bacterium]